MSSVWCLIEGQGPGREDKKACKRWIVYRRTTGGDRELTVENEDGLESNSSPSFDGPLKETRPLDRFSSVSPYDVIEVEKVDETEKGCRRRKGSARRLRELLLSSSNSPPSVHDEGDGVGRVEIRVGFESGCSSKRLRLLLEVGCKSTNSHSWIDGRRERVGRDSRILVFWGLWR